MYSNGVNVTSIHIPIRIGGDAFVGHPYTNQYKAPFAVKITGAWIEVRRYCCAQKLFQ
jgi:hypothetical protein